MYILQMGSRIAKLLKVMTATGNSLNLGEQFICPRTTLLFSIKILDHINLFSILFVIGDVLFWSFVAMLHIRHFQPKMDKAFKQKYSF